MWALKREVCERDKAWPCVFKEENKNICLLVPNFFTPDNFLYKAWPPLPHFLRFKFNPHPRHRLHLFQRRLFNPAQPFIFPLIFFCCPTQTIFAMTSFLSVFCI